MKKVTSFGILVLGSLLIVGMWLSYAVITLGHPMEKWGVFGDKFGALNTLFTGLASVAVVAALWHEREGAKDREREHKELLDAMKRQADETARATRVNILIAKLGSIDAQAASGNRAMSLMSGLKRSPIMDKLNKELFADEDKIEGD